MRDERRGMATRRSEKIYDLEVKKKKTAERSEKRILKNVLDFKLFSCQIFIINHFEAVFF